MHMHGLGLLLFALQCDDIPNHMTTLAVTLAATLATPAAAAPCHPAAAAATAAVI